MRLSRVHQKQRSSTATQETPPADDAPGPPL